MAQYKLHMSNSLIVPNANANLILVEPVAPKSVVPADAANSTLELLGAGGQHSLEKITHQIRFAENQHCDITAADQRELWRNITGLAGIYRDLVNESTLMQHPNS